MNCVAGGQRRQAGGGMPQGERAIIGLLQMAPAAWTAFRPASVAVDESKVGSLVEARNAARKAKDFKESTAFAPSSPKWASC